MKVLKGIAASGGISIGKIFLIEEQDVSVAQKKIPKEEVEKEVERYKEALSQVKEQLLSAKQKLLKLIGKEHMPLAEMYLVMIEDPILNKDVTRKIKEESVNAEYALWVIVEEIMQSFEKMENEYFRERKNDIQELRKQILFQLIGRYRKSITELEKDSIVVAHNLAASEVIRIKEHGVESFVTDVGSRTSHVVIVAQGLDMPTVVGLKNITSVVNQDDKIIVDGTQGIVIINPDKQTLVNYKREYNVQLLEREELKKLKDLPAETQDGHKINLECNLGVVEEMNNILDSGSDGIGLFRTEFIYLNNDKLPTEDEHYETYKKVARKMLPYSVVVRTLDIGGDKLGKFGIDDISNKDISQFLGLRAIRFSLKYPEIFKTQLRAILRASKDGNLKIMFPMISAVKEFRKAKELLEEAKQELRNRHEEFNENIEVGVMIEVPSAAVVADLFAKEADFLSIGTNDLIQYTLAVDRTDESVADLYDPFHLSILRLLKQIIDSGHKAGKWVGLCGDIAADTVFTAILIGMGLDEFSVPYIAVPKVKKMIRSLKLSDAKELAHEVLSQDCAEAVRAVLRRSQISI